MSEASQREVPVTFCRDMGFGRRVPLAGLLGAVGAAAGGPSMALASFLGGMVLAFLFSPVEVFRFRPATKVVLRWIQLPFGIPLTQRAAWKRFDDLAALRVEERPEGFLGYRVWLDTADGLEVVLEMCALGRRPELVPRVAAAARLTGLTPALPAGWPAVEGA